MEQALTDQVVDWVRSRYFGKYRGVVTDNQDPTNRGRIKVRVPAVLGDEQVWAMPCVPYAGDNIGLYAIPKTGSGVWCEFEGGDPSYCIWTGCFWADDQRPTNENGTQATPPLKIVRTEQGLMVSMDDSGQTISVSDENGNNILKIEIQKGQITVKGASKAVVEAPQIELVENSTHPVVFGDELLDYLNQLVEIYREHVHPGQLTLGVFPVTPMIPTPWFPPATPQLISKRVKTG
jgi:uncharacterized protein involved in type VI secretion and phage assembly